MKKSSNYAEESTSVGVGIGAESLVDVFQVVDSLHGHGNI